MAGTHLGKFEELFGKLDEEAKNADPEVLEQKAALQAALRAHSGGAVTATERALPPPPPRAPRGSSRNGYLDEAAAAQPADVN